MSTIVLGLLAETSIHPGAGGSAGVIDQPVAREATTDYPVLVGSGLKGALLDHARQIDLPNTEAVFGKPETAGQILVSDARLLLLPVRSLNGAYKWATCPLLLERLRRDLTRAGLPSALPESPKIDPNQALAADGESLFLEERRFQVAGAPDPAICEQIETLIPHQQTRKRLSHQLVILGNDDFAWFARYGLPVNARNKLDKDNKTSENLWYEETLAPDTLLYALIGERANGLDVRELFAAKLFPEDKRYLQAAGNETVGQGWFAVEILAEAAQ